LVECLQIYWQSLNYNIRYVPFTHAPYPLFALVPQTRYKFDVIITLDIYIILGNPYDFLLKFTRL
jgi:hypothetical protein